jgi:hypothetical protein
LETQLIIDSIPSYKTPTPKRHTFSTLLAERGSFDQHSAPQPAFGIVWPLKSTTYEILREGPLRVDFVMATSSSNMTIDKPNQFPWKLYDMLDAAEKRNEEHVISWIRDGKAFKVHNRELFIEQYMKKMFNQTKFKSFQRQLNLWGFERVQNGPDKGSYYHPLFVQGNRDCCQRLTRVRLKGGGDRPSRNDDESSLPAESAGSAAASVSTPTAASSRTPSSEGSRVGGAASPSGATVALEAVSGAIVTQSATSAAADTARRRREAIVAAAAEMSGMPLSSFAVEGSLPLDSQHNHLAEMLLYRNHERNSSITNSTTTSGSRPDVSVVFGTPIYTSADSSNLAVNSLLQQQYENHQLQQQPTGHPLQQDDRRSQEQHPAQNDGRQEGGQQPWGESGGHRPVSDQLAALLSVSAQRRREEELALFLALSNGMGGAYM